MDRIEKQQVVETLQRDLAETACVVVTHQSGLNVTEATQLRRQVRGAGASFR
ncbi:MAG: 50S ribosomal protein L10, partial [Planctomycetaceae bacterium]|nr:50S ribosomal protein L10 [Planctomycetaceae bacterium]